MSPLTPKKSATFFRDAAKAGSLFTVRAVWKRGPHETLVFELDPEGSGGDRVVVDQSHPPWRVGVMLEPKVGDVVRFVPNDGTLGSVVIDVNGADRDIVWLVIKSRPHQERGDMRSLGPEDVNRAFVVEQIEPKGWAINRRTRKRRSVMMCPLGGEDSRRVLINEEDIASGQVDFPSIHDEKFYFGLGDRVVVNRGDQFRYLYAVQRATAAEVIRGRRTSEKE